jgi:protein involved in polysaccharide export with SLBB domain
MEPSTATDSTPTVFGHKLFQGSFSQKAQSYFNPEYKIAVGDTINLKIWGSFELELDTQVDTQGNIFIPKVGTVPVAGVSNKDIVSTITAKVRKSYNQKIYVYANVATFQPVWVFVTGNVNQPGLYQGMASDSVIQFIDKAKGINLQYGSFRNITVVRNNKPIRSVDLYDFLTAGRLELFQFHDGDSVVIGNIGHRITIQGDVKRPFMFEFLKPNVTLREIIALALPNPSATNCTLTRWTLDNKKLLASYALNQGQGIAVQAGDTVEFYADHHADSSTITIAGEHNGPHTLLLPKNYNFAELIGKIIPTSMSDMEAVQLFRKSVAEKQKQLLDAKLQELETLTLTNSAASRDEALLRSAEAQSILTFIERAKKLEPKGLVVIHDVNHLNEIFLEDGDQIYIPRKSNIVLVQGEVSLPGAHTYIAEKNVADYIALAGGFSERANQQRVLVIRQNGSVVKCDSASSMKKAAIQKGDSVLVLPKLEGKIIQATKDITQILFQIAVATGVFLAI